MNTKKKLLIAATAGLTGLGLINNSVASDSSSGKVKKEKCKGIAAKGANSCGAHDHACGGYAKKDFDSQEWVYVKSGTCSKLQSLVKNNPELRDFLKSTTNNARKYVGNFKK